MHLFFAENVTEVDVLQQKIHDHIKGIDVLMCYNTVAVVQLSLQLSGMSVLKIRKSCFVITNTGDNDSPKSGISVAGMKIQSLHSQLHGEFIFSTPFSVISMLSFSKEFP